jgi:hypothetical protein
MLSIDKIAQADKLSPRSKTLYTDYLKDIANRLYNGDLTQLVKYPHYVKQKLEERHKKGYSTIGIYIVAINKLLELHPEYPLDARTRKDWQDIRKDIRIKRISQYENNELPESTVKKMVGFDELKVKFCELQQSNEIIEKQKVHMQYILFAMFLNIKPKRADLGNVYLSADGNVPAEYVTHGNYIVLHNRPRLVMNNYKTRERYGKIVEPLNEELVKILRTSLRQFPREYLIVQAKKLEPFVKNNSYSQFVLRAFRQHFSKAMGASLWRHVYVSENVDFTNASWKDLRDNARLSGQSVTTQMMIYKNVKKPENLRMKSKSEVKRLIRCNAK